MDLYGKLCKRDWMAKAVYLIQMLPTFSGHCNRYFWDIRLEILRLPVPYFTLSACANKIFQKWIVFVFTESWSRDQVMQRAYSNCAHPSPGIILTFCFGKAASAPRWGRAVRTTTPPWGLKQCANASSRGRQHQNFILQDKLHMSYLWPTQGSYLFFRELDLFGSLPVPSPRCVASYPAM